MNFFRKLLIATLFFGVVLFSLTSFQENTFRDNDQSWTTKTRTPDPNQNNCLICHTGISHIRDPQSGMMQQIYETAEKAGFSNNECIVCHGGNPLAIEAEKAHDGTIKYFTKNEGPKNFYPDPGSPWINENSCGQCHTEQVSAQMTSLMFTEAGKI